METVKAAAVSLYKLTTRSKAEGNSPPEYIHYLPLFLIDENDNPTPIITDEQGSTPKTIVGLTEPQEETFIVMNEFDAKTQHRCGGIRAYVTPHDRDLLSERSSCQGHTNQPMMDSDTRTKRMDFGTRRHQIEAKTVEADVWTAISTRL